MILMFKLLAIKKKERPQQQKKKTYYVLLGILKNAMEEWSQPGSK